MFVDPQAVLEEVRRGFDGRRVVVVGDLMLDRYLWGRVERISPEAPVPVVRLERETETAGGAANVARNLAALGLTVSLAGITGDDGDRAALLRDLTANRIETGAVLAAANRVTTVKTRVVGNHQQMLRIDAERALPLAAPDAERLLAAVAPLLPGAGALVLSDYAKGVLTEPLCQGLIRAAREADVPVLVDPKGRDFARYVGATLITPNRSELALAAGVPATDLDALLAAAAALRADLGLRWLVLTLSEQGMALVGPNGTRQIPAVAREVFDVSGAGDTVIAAIAAGLSARLDPVDTAHLANLAAGVVVGKVGTATVSAAELLAAVTGESALEQAAKVGDPNRTLERVRAWQGAGERVVFTNGCFDLLHVGHVTYLERARRYGHRLVVGLNTDRSVRALKGPSRPLIREDDRARVLAALASVDAVVLFDADTPLALIEQLRPDVLAKGADYKEQEVVGAAQVKSWGGQVVLVPLVEDRSTTGIIRRMNPDAGEQ
jgi:D-beta-D-heptose 7-phosphate kinase/D-beta-D-heptose 1-phosphate adenosyltransferase